MKNLSDLVEEYQVTKSSLILDEIASILHPLIKEKSSYIFYRKYYCIYLEGKKKGYFNLSRLRYISLEDIEQDLWLTIFGIIKKYNPKKSFHPYLYGTLWQWKPSFINEDFIRQITVKRLYIIDTQGISQDMEIEDYKDNSKVKLILKNNWDKLNKDEQNILNEILNNLNIQNKELANKLKLTESRITQILAKLRETLKPFFYLFNFM